MVSFLSVYGISVTARPPEGIIKAALEKAAPVVFMRRNYHRLHEKCKHKLMGNIHRKCIME
jgi:hypothetical protein